MQYKISHNIIQLTCIITLVFLSNYSIFANNSVNALTTASASGIDKNTIEKNALSQVEQAFNGTISGLYSLRSSGQQFGLSNYNLYVRGKATTADNAPLILVDGVDANINLLDPAEIASIQVLKDAAELAIYGLRGANGVILIQTKKGKNSGNYMQVDMRSGFQSPSTISPKLNAYQYTTLHNEANINDGSNPIYQPDNYLNPTDDYRYPDTNLPKDFLKKSTLYNYYNFTAGGGNDIAQYFALLSYTKQDGIFNLPGNNDGLKQSYNERYNFRTNLNVKLGNGFQLDSYLSAVFDDRRSPWLGNSYTVNNTRDYVFNAIINTPANAFPLLNPNGSLGGNAEYRDNPIGLLTAGLRIENTRKLTANILLKKDLSELIKGLSAFAQYSFENYNAYYKGNYNTFAVYQLNDDDTYTAYGADDTKVTTTGGQMSDYFSDINLRAGTELSRRIGNHQIFASFIYDQYTSFVSGDNPPYKWLGTAAKILYGYNDRYFAQFAAAYHGSNNYIKGKRFGFFPAASIAWVLSEENFIKENLTIDFLKTRASVGITGNDKTGGSRFMYRQAYFNGGGYGFGNPNGTSQGSYEGVLSNPDTSWEKDTKINAGFDLTILNKKFSISADYFFENRNSILIDQANITPSMIGISLPQYNAGIIQNKGVEGDVRYSNQIGALSVYTGFNFLYAKNKIIDLKELNYPENEQYRYRKGNPVNAIFGLVADGIYQDEDAIQQHGVISSFGALAPGDLRYIDQNEDGIINEADKKVIGNAFPEFIYGLNAGFAMKGFDFSVFAEGSALVDLHLIPGQFSTYAYENRWTETHTSNAFPRLSLNSKHNTQTSSYWIENGSVFRLSSIELGYSIPTIYVQRIGLSNVRFYAKLHDFIATVSKRESRDQEAPEIGYTLYPAMKTALFGISINL
jgi:TonB-linked SusC/RagA family outer membrane protein